MPYCLPLRQPWRSARGDFDVRQGWLIRLQSDMGLAGYGDCAPLPMAGTESRDRAAAMLERAIPDLPGLEPERVLQEIGRLAPGASAARCGLETALADLLAQQNGQPLARWLNPAASPAVRVNASLGGVDAQLVERASAAVNAGYAVLKLKVGLAAAQEELARLRELAQSLPAGIGLRLDANGAWDVAAACDYLGALAGLPVESVEDPLSRPVLDDWRRLQESVPFPLAADESLLEMGEAVWRDALVRRVVLKPMVLGLMPAWEVACRAKETGVECVVTSTVDSAIGVAAAFHLAAAVANDLAHGLATSPWLERDVGAPPWLAGGWMRLDGMLGLGCFPLRVER